MAHNQLGRSQELSTVLSPVLEGQLDVWVAEFARRRLTWSSQPIGSGQAPASFDPGIMPAIPRHSSQMEHTTDKLIAVIADTTPGEERVVATICGSYYNADGSPASESPAAYFSSNRMHLQTVPTTEGNAAKHNIPHLTMEANPGKDYPFPLTGDTDLMVRCGIGGQRDGFQISAAGSENQLSLFFASQQEQ